MKTNRVLGKGMFVVDAARRLSVDIATVYVLVRQGKLRYRPKEEWPNEHCRLVDVTTVIDYLHGRRYSSRWHEDRELEVEPRHVPVSRPRVRKVARPVESVLQAVIDEVVG